VEERIKVSDLDAPAERKGPGRPAKPDKRVMLNTRLDPDVHTRLVALAEESGQTLTRQTEALIRLGLNGGAGPAVAAASLAGALHAAPAPKLMKAQRNPADVFGLAIGREKFAVSLLIGWLQKHALYHFYPEHKNVGAPWLDNRRAVKCVADSIGALLQLIGPHEDRRFFAKVRKYHAGTATGMGGLTVEQMYAIDVARDLIDGELGIIEERSRQNIRDWLGETVVARLTQRLLTEPPIEPPDGESTDG
jgi:hypothetical protein